MCARQLAPAAGFSGSKVGAAKALTSVQTTLLDVSGVALKVGAFCSAPFVVSGIGPKVALKRLSSELQGDRAAASTWRVHAKVAAVMGSCPKSHSSFNSGLRHWLSFIETLYGIEQVETKAFPPGLDDVLAWSHTFRCIGTFVNYAVVEGTNSKCIGPPFRVGAPLK